MNKRDFIIIFQILVGFLPVLLFGKANYAKIEEFYAETGLISAYFFGVFMNSSVYLVNRYQLLWKRYFYGNLLSLLGVVGLALLIGHLYLRDFNGHFIIIVFFMTIKNSVHSIGLTLGLYRSFFWKELFSIIILLLYFVSLLYLEFNLNLLLGTYFLYMLPSIFFIIRLFRRNFSWALFDYRNWFSGYFDPLASGLIITVPRLIILSSDLIEKDTYLLSIRFSFALVSLTSSFFWIRTTRELSKEFYHENFRKTVIYLDWAKWLLILGVLSVLIFFINSNVFTFTISTILVYLLAVILTTFLRYNKSELGRNVYFCLISLSLSLGFSLNYNFYLLVYISILSIAFLYFQLYINRHTISLD
uniref:hypothetical protein n=1 Tax=Algoriphagus sp. TaxID=1872435 RepID=UPI0040487FA8